MWRGQEWGCDTVSSGAAYPSFSDSFNLNPASLPTFLSPIGIEAIASNRGERSKSRANLSLIKGLDGVGFGAASNSDNTFFTYNLVQAFSGTGYQDRIKTFVAQNAVQSSLNFGTAFAPFVGKLLGQNFIPKVGANLRFNELTEQWDLQLGTSFNFSILNLGASHKRSAGDTSNDIPNIMTTVLTAGTKLSILNFWII